MKITTFLIFVISWCKAMILPKVSFRKICATAGVISSFMSPLMIGEVVHANALNAAVKAMTETKKEKVEYQRSNEDLSEGAKKRRALALCKEYSSRAAAGYSSASECNSAVLSGNYGIFNAKELPETSIVTPKSVKVPSTAKNQEPSVTSVTTPKSKVADLSDLSSAAKKRRALAACKRPEARKFARMGSEGKCTERVLSGELGDIIESIEYGL